jgi:hypothetical protein
VDAHEPAQHLLQPRRQGVVRERLVRPERVAADGRDLEGVQDRRERRLGQEREVGVPDAAEREGLVSLASRTTAMTSGCSGVGSMNGTGLNGPNRRLNATCRAAVSCWPRQNTT